MYLRSLRLQNIKLFRDLQLDFMKNGNPRMWTIILGENGTCKTTLLQAIAMAASGPTLAGQLATSGRTDILRSLRRREGSPEVHISAEFGFSIEGHKDKETEAKTYYKNREYPSLVGKRPKAPPILLSELSQSVGKQNLSGTSYYKGHKRTKLDPLEQIRSNDPIEPLWFVAGYGVDRNLPQPGGTLGQTGIQERLRSLFGNYSISATRWLDHFKLTENDVLSAAFMRTMRELAHRANGLFPDIKDINLENKDAHDPTDRHMVRENVAGTEQVIPTIWMSQGYQSSIAWIADLVGHILQEAQTDIPSQEMEGLVLIDEIDLHLHPTWQVGLIQALREVFPAIQFIATTHSPLVITGCHADEIIRLDRKDGAVVQLTNPAPDPLLMTGTELYWNYFDLERLIPNAIGQAIYNYKQLARNGARSPDEERRLTELGDHLDRLNLRPQGIVLPPRRA